MSQPLVSIKIFFLNALKSVKKRFRLLFIKSVLFYKKYKVKDSIIIFSEKRGGSTWLLEVISNLPKTTVNWEPLNGLGVVPKDFNFGENPHIPFDNDDSKYIKLFDKILTFKISSNYTLSYCRAKTLLASNKVITKFVGANMISEWLLYNFNFNTKPIFLIRNPIDCCISQLLAFKRHYKGRIKSRLPLSLNNKRFLKHQKYLSSLEDDLEYQIGLWLINNMEVIKSERVREDCTIVYYEELIINPDQEFKKLFDNLGYNEEIIKKIDFKRPSDSDFKGGFDPDPNKQLFKNLDRLSANTKIKIQNIYDYFNFKLYDVTSPFPRKRL